MSAHHLPALDGLRALAVAGVLAYHLGWSWASGGYLGVDLFFVLSGFLITSLLVEERLRTGSIRLGAFWGRRVRRLLPALLAVMVAVALYVVIDGRFGPPGATALVDLSGLRGDALATLFYVANWHAIFAGQSYFAQFAAPSPFGHTWSLAIEEQFYLLWPLVLVAVLGWSRRSWRQVGTVVTVAGTAVSAALMALLYHPGSDPTRVYFGTDTRMFDLMAGATVAMLAAARPQPGVRARRTLHVAGLLAAVVLAAFWVRAGSSRGLPLPFMYRGGFLACAALAVLVIADARLFERGPLGVALSWAPLRAVGTISYGIYLWHWPIFVYLTGARTGLFGASLDLARVGATVAMATASYWLLERPIRRRHFFGWFRRSLAPLAVAVTAAAVVVATVPAIAAPARRAPSTALGVRQRVGAVPGSGGFEGEVPITLPEADRVSPQHPLRVMLIGDSVMNDAAAGITQAFDATGEATVADVTYPGFGLSTAPGWPKDFPAFIRQYRPELVIAMWSWDDDWALDHPAAYTDTLERAVRVLLAPGDGVAGVLFMQFPLIGPIVAGTPTGNVFLSTNPSSAQIRAVNAERSGGERAWNRIVRSLPARFPGKVMYLPVGGALLDHGEFATWLPPLNRPGAPRSRWIRVRYVDNTHLCPAGAVRYADALLVDMRQIFGLSAARGDWSVGQWTNDPRFNDPPGSCPDDHPPASPRSSRSS